MNNYRQLVDELSCRHTLCDADMRKLISNVDNCDVSYLMEKAREAGCPTVLKKKMESIGYNIVTGRGDCKRQVN